MDGRLFKKLVAGSTIPLNDIPSGNDIITIEHKEGDAGGITTLKRYVAYSNTDDKPEVKAYDVKTAMKTSGFGMTDGVPYISVPKDGTDLQPFGTNPETVRFMQFNAAAPATSLWTSTNILVTKI